MTGYAGYAPDRSCRLNVPPILEQSSRDNSRRYFSSSSTSFNCIHQICVLEEEKYLLLLLFAAKTAAKMGDSPYPTYPAAGQAILHILSSAWKLVQFRVSLLRPFTVDYMASVRRGSCCGGRAELKILENLP